MLSRTVTLQGAFYLATGLWPIFHMKSFEAITGPKTDKWLVKTVGGLIAVVGGVLLLDRHRPSLPTRRLSAGAALALGTADFVFAGKGRISPVYLLDGVLQTV